MALTADRLTNQVAPEISLIREFPVKADAKIYRGALVCLDGGYAIAGKTATGLTCVGRAEEYVDNTGGANGDVTVRVRRGIFQYNNSTGSDEITKADIGNECYVVDDETVSKTAGDDGQGNPTRSAAGKVFDVDDEGVWVEITA